MNIIIVHNTGQHLFLVNDFTVSITESLHVLYYVLQFIISTGDGNFVKESYLRQREDIRVYMT